MIIRIWTTRFIPEKKDDYLNFAKDNSLPMFKLQKGILGVNVLVKDDKSLVLTYWDNIDDIALMENNILYKDSVAKIKDAGFLIEPQQVEIFDLPLYSF